MSTDLQPGRDAIVRRARAAGLNLSPTDVVWDTATGWTIDGMPAADWITAMTH